MQMGRVRDLICTNGRPQGFWDDRIRALGSFTRPARQAVLLSEVVPGKGMERGRIEVSAEGALALQDASNTLS